MAAVTLVVGLVAALILWTRYLERRDARRHGWRLELLQARAAAWKADEVEALKQRLQKLELRGMR